MPPNDERHLFRDMGDMIDNQRAELAALRAQLAEARGIVAYVDAWGNGIRHETAHERKMVRAARAFLAKPEPGV